MYKLFLITILFGLCAAGPLRSTEEKEPVLASEKNIALESALLIPEFEIETNSSVTLETMPRIFQHVEEKLELTENLTTVATTVLKKRQYNLMLETTTIPQQLPPVETTAAYGGYEATTVPQFIPPVETTAAYGGYETTTVPQFVPPVETTVAYGGYEATTIPQFVPPVETTASYGGYEATTVPQFVPPVETTVAYGGYEATTVPQFIPPVETTVAYGGYEATTVPQFVPPIETTASYGGYEATTVPQFVPPVETTVAYGGYEATTVPQFIPPVETTVAYGGYEATTIPQFVPPVETTVAYGGYEATTVPQFVPPVDTTVAYGGYEATTIPQFVPPVETTVAYGGYEATTVPQFIPPVETTVAYGGYEATTVPQFIPPVETTTVPFYETTAAYGGHEATTVPQFVPPAVETAKYSGSGYKRREAPVQTLMEQVTQFIQEKHSNIGEFIATSYCQRRGFSFYKPYPNDQTKYVQCNTWGHGLVRECEHGRLWDQFLQVCTLPSIIQDSENFTRLMTEIESKQSTQAQSCNNTLFTCVNGGRCVESESEWRCACKKAFTGPYCQFVVEQGSIFSAIMTNTFNFSQFEEWAVRSGLNDSLIGKDMTDLHREFSAVTVEEIMEYLRMFKEEHVRYDTAVNLLVEDVLEDIYPDLYYMSIFNVSENSLLHVVRLIPAVISYTRYSAERYDEVLAKYNDVLEKLVVTLNSSIPNVQTVSTEYTHIIAHILNETGTLDQMFANANRTTKAQIEEVNFARFNKTAESMTEFTLSMNAMRTWFITYMRDHPELVNTRVGQLEKIEEVRELISVFEELTREGVVMINKLFSYGFWSITDTLARQF